MRPKTSSPAHHSENFAELVCSNSLRSDSLNNAVGILKEEMRHLDSIIMESADATRVPAGSALAVDRQAFSRRITEQLKQHPLIEVIQEEVTQIPDGPCIIASGPLTSDALAKPYRNTPMRIISISMMRPPRSLKRTALIFLRHISNPVMIRERLPISTVR